MSRAYYASQARWAQRRILRIKAAHPEWFKSGAMLLQLSHERAERARYMRLARATGSAA